MTITAPTNHGTATANAMALRSNRVKPGRFGLLFPELAIVPWTTGDPQKDGEVAMALGAAMHQSGQTVGVIPAGFTYFGQFVDHDITFDPTSLGENRVDVAGLVSFRTPAHSIWTASMGAAPPTNPICTAAKVTARHPSSCWGRWFTRATPLPARRTRRSWHA